MTVLVDANAVENVRAALIAAGETVVDLGRVTDTGQVDYTGTLA